MLAEDSSGKSLLVSMGLLECEMRTVVIELLGRLMPRERAVQSAYGALDSVACKCDLPVWFKKFSGGHN